MDMNREDTIGKERNADERRTNGKITGYKEEERRGAQRNGGKGAEKKKKTAEDRRRTGKN